MSTRGLIDRDREAAHAERYVTRLRIKTRVGRAPVEVAVGRQSAEGRAGALAGDAAAVLILDEPTQGIDVGAKAEIHALMHDLAEQGLAILMISSELPEILGMSDRVAVMRGGRDCRRRSTAPTRPRRRS